jgi:hypothetical protein
MPSGRDSFRRNRVAPFVLFYFTMSTAVSHCLPFRRSTRYCGKQLFPNYFVLPVGDREASVNSESAIFRSRPKANLRLHHLIEPPRPFRPQWNFFSSADNVSTKT